MYMESPSELCGLVASTSRKRPAKGAKIASDRAEIATKTTRCAPRAGNPVTDDGQIPAAHLNGRAVVGHNSAPWSSGHIPLAPYDPAPQADIIDQIVYLHRRRQAAIRAKTKVILMMKAEVRSMLCSDADFEEDKTTERTTAFGKSPRKLSKKAQSRVDAAIKEAMAEIADGVPSSDIASTIFAYTQSEALFEQQCDGYRKQLVKLAKRLPVYEWVKGVPGFGDVSFATIVGECGDIGTYKSVSAVWKRLGLAVINGRRQGNPGEGATAQDWVDHGYNRARRSVSYVAREHVIGGMGKWRPVYGSDLDDATYYQRVYAERARYEADKLGLPVTLNEATGNESYKKHVAMRAHRYVEKRLLKHLYIEWRRAA